MIRVLSVSGAFVGLIIANWALCWHVGQSAYRRGFEAGEKAGRLAADNWWLGAEQSADQARQKIWRDQGAKDASNEWL